MKYALTKEALTLFTAEGPITMHREDDRWDRAKELLEQEDWEQLEDYIKPIRAVKKYVSRTGFVTIEDDMLYYKDQQLSAYAATQVIRMAGDNLPIEPLVNFIERTMENPSETAIAELLQFLEYGDLPLTPDGHFLAYKRVREDYMDCHSGTCDNHVGKFVEMPRTRVQASRDITCSQGLHFCSMEYLKSFWGAHTMVLKIDPKDVVSIPADYNNTKGRCCKYQVVGEIEQQIDRNNHWGKVVVDEFEQDDAATA